mgnify:CR=1 FL=1
MQSGTGQVFVSIIELRQELKLIQKKWNLNLSKVYDFATTTPLDEIRFILEAKRLNLQAAERSFKGNYGHELGKTLQSSRSEQSIMGSNTFTHILSYTSAACDARMAGAMIPVMSNSGSGNQGNCCYASGRSFLRKRITRRKKN